MRKFVSRRTLLVLVIIASLVAVVGAYSRAKAHSNAVAIRHLEPDAKSGLKHVGNAAATASDEKLPASLQAAEEAYQARAFPADAVSIELTQQAQNSWTKAKGRGHGKNKNKAGTWTLAGPSNSTQPSILNFSGNTYQTSGRVTALAIDPNCNQGHCRLWLGAAGGGVWRTDKALHNNPKWTWVSAGLPSNAIGTLTYDAATDTLYAGTGEPNAAVDNEAGLGLFKSTDGGDTWTHLPAITTTPISGAYTGDAFKDRSINSVVVDPTNPNVLYVGSMSGLRGISSVLSGRCHRRAEPLPGRGVYKSTDGGQTFTYLNGATLPFPLRGVTNVALDPSNHEHRLRGPVSARASTGRMDGGSTWTQIFAPVNPRTQPRSSVTRSPSTKLPNGKTRMYVGAGDNGTFAARLFRSDDATAAAPAFVDITTIQSAGYCGAQCWYDNVVYTPAGQPRRGVPGRQLRLRQRGRPGARWRHRQADERSCVHLLDRRQARTSATSPATPARRAARTACIPTSMRSPSRRRTRTSCSSAPTAASCGRAAATPTSRRSATRAG